MAYSEKSYQLAKKFYEDKKSSNQKYNGDEKTISSTTTPIYSGSGQTARIIGKDMDTGKIIQDETINYKPNSGPKVGSQTTTRKVISKNGQAVVVDEITTTGVTGKISTLFGVPPESRRPITQYTTYPTSRNEIITESTFKPRSEILKRKEERTNALLQNKPYSPYSEQRTYTKTIIPNLNFKFQETKSQLQRSKERYGIRDNVSQKLPTSSYVDKYNFLPNTDKNVYYTYDQKSLGIGRLDVARKTNFLQNFAGITESFIVDKLSRGSKQSFKEAYYYNPEPYRLAKDIGTTYVVSGTTGYAIGSALVGTKTGVKILSVLKTISTKLPKISRGASIGSKVLLYGSIPASSGITYAKTGDIDLSLRSGILTTSGIFGYRTGLIGSTRVPSSIIRQRGIVFETPTKLTRVSKTFGKRGGVEIKRLDILEADKISIDEKRFYKGINKNIFTGRTQEVRGFGKGNFDSLFLKGKGGRITAETFTRVGTPNSKETMFVNVFGKSRNGLPKLIGKETFPATGVARNSRAYGNYNILKVVQSSKRGENKFILDYVRKSTLRGVGRPTGSYYFVKNNNRPSIINTGKNLFKSKRAESFIQKLISQEIPKNQVDPLTKYSKLSSQLQISRNINQINSVSNSLNRRYGSISKIASNFNFPFLIVNKPSSKLNLNNGSKNKLNLSNEIKNVLKQPIKNTYSTKTIVKQLTSQKQALSNKQITKQSLTYQVVSSPIYGGGFNFKLPRPPRIILPKISLPSESSRKKQVKPYNFSKQNRFFKYTATIQGRELGIKQSNKNLKFTGLEIRGV